MTEQDNTPLTAVPGWRKAYIVNLMAVGKRCQSLAFKTDTLPTVFHEISDVLVACPCGSFKTSSR